MIFMASSTAPAEAASPAQPLLPVEDVTQYGPQRTIQRRLLEALQPFTPAERSRESNLTPAERSRESNPRRIMGEMKSEMLAAERRSHSLESELSEAVDIFRGRETWWRQSLLELQEAVGTERSRFEQLALTAEAEFEYARRFGQLLPTGCSIE